MGQPVPLSQMLSLMAAVLPGYLREELRRLHDQI